MYTGTAASNLRVGFNVAIPHMPGLQLSEIKSIDKVYNSVGIETDRLIVSIEDAPYAFVIARWQYVIVETASMAMQVNNYVELLNWLEVGTDTPQ